MEMAFPKPDNSGKAQIVGNQVRFSYLDSLSKAVTETKPLLTAQEIIGLVEAREKRFDEAPPGARESDASRRERKYIAAQPEGVLKQAWEEMTGHTKMEFAMMLDMNSHHGLSDPKWMATHAGNVSQVLGDDQKPIGSTAMKIRRTRTSIYAPDEGSTDVLPDTGGANEEAMVPTNAGRTMVKKRPQDPGHGKTPLRLKKGGRQMKGRKPASSYAMRSFGGM